MIPGRRRVCRKKRGEPKRAGPRPALGLRNEKGHGNSIRRSAMTSILKRDDVWSRPPGRSLRLVSAESCRPFNRFSRLKDPRQKKRGRVRPDSPAPLFSPRLSSLPRRTRHGNLKHSQRISRSQHLSGLRLSYPDLAPERATRLPRASGRRRALLGASGQERRSLQASRPRRYRSRSSHRHSPSCRKPGRRTGDASSTCDVAAEERGSKRELVGKRAGSTRPGRNCPDRSHLARRSAGSKDRRRSPRRDCDA